MWCPWPCCRTSCIFLVLSVPLWFIEARQSVLCLASQTCVPGKWRTVGTAYLGKNRHLFREAAYILKPSFPLWLWTVATILCDVTGTSHQLPTSPSPNNFITWAQWKQQALFPNPREWSGEDDVNSACLNLI